MYLAERPAGVLPVEVASLAPYHRALIVADGTVTRFVEAWAMEPVEVYRLAQAELRLQHALEWLDAAAGEPAISRSVLLRGRRSAQLFLYASSLILPGRLPAAMRKTLASSAEGLGQIIVSGGLESRREGLWFGRQQLDDLPTAVAATGQGDFLVRCYRLLAGGQPVMMITERFPWGQVPTTAAED